MSPLPPSTAPATDVVDVEPKRDIENAEVESASTKEKDSSEKSETEEESIPVGMLADPKCLYQQKDKDDSNKFQWVIEEPKDVADAAENKETAKHSFLIRLKQSYDSRKKYEIHSIIVQSPLLKEALGKVLGDYPGVTTTLKRLEFHAPFRPFVHRWTRFKETLDSTEDALTKSHLQKLYDTLYEELKDAISAKNDLVENGVCTFEHLWTIFEPGALIYGSDEGQERIYEVGPVIYAKDGRTGLNFLRLQASAVDWDGTKFGSTHEYLQNFEFEGTKPITKLAAFPLEFHPQEQEVRERLLARGKLFEHYAGYHYMSYQGPALTYGRCGLVRQKVDSRIIIDCEAHNRFRPNEAVWFNYLHKPVAQRTYDSDNDDSDYSDDDSESMESSNIYLIDPQEGEDAPKVRALTEKQLLTSVAIVRGYAVRQKKWFLFFIDMIRPISFSETAFESLVLPTEQKRLIRAFVESQVKYKETFDDVIAGKGKGMIMLLSGPPGVGKTLTAESVAEDMHVPLYMLSAGDLGLDPAEIEETLNTVLEMVAKWNAVLLLDEADVFLEARSTHELERNKMVSIFLRMLEYYQGILFLTTNRIENIDEAFHSRIHVSLNYPSLNVESRRHIWSSFLATSGSAITSSELDRLAKTDLNGRQIKNVLKTAQMLARQEAKGMDAQVNIGHIETILSIERAKKF